MSIPKRRSPKAAPRKKASPAAPAKTPRYEPTERDKAAAAEFQAKREAALVPTKFSVTKEKDTNFVKLDHPDTTIAQMHTMSALAVVDLQLYDSLLSDLCQMGSRGGDPHQGELNHLLAVVRGIEPRDAVETLLAVQMAAVHKATIQVARRLKQVDTIQQQDSASTCLNKLARTFAMQVEALKKHRSTGEQTVNVKHLNVHPGGQAVVGNVSTGGRGEQKSEHQPHEPIPEHVGPAAGPKVLGHSEGDRAVVPLPGSPGLERVPHARRGRRSA